MTSMILDVLEAAILEDHGRELGLELQDAMHERRAIAL